MLFLLLYTLKDKITKFFLFYFCQPSQCKTMCLPLGFEASETSQTKVSLEDAGLV